jgi:hypothetical protein
LIRPPEIILQPSPDASCMSVEDELREWKKSRDRGFHIPWRQLSLMAGLSFGIASFVLPDSINDVVQWPLYALSAASFYAGFRKRRKQSSPSATVPKWPGRHIIREFWLTDDRPLEADAHDSSVLTENN